MRLLRKMRHSLARALYLGSGGLIALNDAGATATETAVGTFVELKGASVGPAGSSGLQVIKLADGTLLTVSEERALVREGMVFVRTEVADAIGVAPETRGKLLEIMEANHSHSSASHGHFGTMASTLGTITGTMVVASAMDDLSQDLVTFSTTALEAIDDTSTTETLDGEEETLEKETEPETQPNDAPVFDAAPTNGEANESAEDGSEVGAIVQADDPEGAVVTYTIKTQDVDGAFSVEPSTGVIRVADSDKINFEAHETLDLTILATDPSGAQAEQTVTIAILDDPADTLMTTASYSVAHPSFSSGAFVLSDSNESTTYFGHAGVTPDLENDTNSLLIELFVMPTNYLYHDAVPGGLSTAVGLSSSPFTALAEVNAAEFTNDFLTLTSYVETASGDNWLGFAFDGLTLTEQAALASAIQVKTVDQDISGVVEATYHLTGSTITKAGDEGFTQTDTIFSVGPGDIWHLADLTGDGDAELILKKAGVGAADVYQNLGTAFDTTPMAETMLTGVNLDDLAGGRALDISIRDHFSDGNQTVMLLGETDAFLYELT